MNNPDLDKFLNKNRSAFDEFKDDILYLSHRGATQKAILEYLNEKGFEIKPSTQSNLSKWLKRQQTKKKKTITVKIENDERSMKPNEGKEQKVRVPKIDTPNNDNKIIAKEKKGMFDIPTIQKKGWQD